MSWGSIQYLLSPIVLLLVIIKLYLLTWVLICVLRFPLSENLFLHISHAYGFSPVCLLIWILRVLDLMNACSQYLHLKGLSPECLLIWSVKWPCVVKFLVQPWIEQANGFSPEWILKCVFRFPFSVKVLLHPALGQVKGFSPVYHDY